MERVRIHEALDAIAFKEEMRQRAEEALAGLSPAERIRRTREQIESGPLAAWWASLRRPAAANPKS